MSDVAVALRQAARIGPYFVTQDVSGPGWSPVAALVGAPSAPNAVVCATRRELATRHRARLSSVEPRVAASIHFLDVAARLISPVLASTVIADTVPALTLRNTWWRARSSGALTIGITAERADEPAADVDGVAGQLGTHLVEPLLAPLARSYQERFGLADLLLWGNVASAVVGAAGQLISRRPPLGPRLDGIVRALLQATPLAGAVRRLPPDFLRNSCCLYYRLPDGGLCGDCVLRVRAESA